MTCSAQEGGSAGPVSPSCSPCTGVRVGAQQGEVAAEGGAEDGGHRRVVDLVCSRAHDWLVLHSDTVMNA
ncbi:hypothetical protein AB0L20_30540, partial [Streptomyces albidoflavus]|uniref:hypothetical protein n=1 Tax=Streptomyces albidoflavus TaxID=1886 RepID=UPI003431F7A6